MRHMRRFWQFRQFFTILMTWDIWDTDYISDNWERQYQHSHSAQLRNVNSFTRSKTLELNFTPRKARKSRQFWDVSETKLTKMIVLENKCWQLFQIRVVFTQKSDINCANLFKIGLIWSYCVFSQTFYPNLKIFLHGYIRHIRDILQLWIKHLTV